MATVVDTSALIAFYDSSIDEHEEVVAAFRASPGPLVVPPLVLAEFDFLSTTFVGGPATVAALEQLAGSSLIATLDAETLDDAIEVERRYPDLNLGLTDATVVVAAHRAGTSRLLTLDRRQFTVVRPLSDEPAFDLRPG